MTPLTWCTGLHLILYSIQRTATDWRWAMSHSNKPPVRNRAPLTARSSRLRCVSAAENPTAAVYSKTGRIKPRKDKKGQGNYQTPLASLRPIGPTVLPGHWGAEWGSEWLLWGVGPCGHRYNMHSSTHHTESSTQHAAHNTHAAHSIHYSSRSTQHTTHITYAAHSTYYTARSAQHAAQQQSTQHATYSTQHTLPRHTQQQCRRTSTRSTLWRVIHNSSIGARTHAAVMPLVGIDNGTNWLTLRDKGTIPLYSGV